jgi:hypothetical protein
MDKIEVIKLFFRKAKNIIMALLYSILYIIIYKEYLNPVWDYAHYHLYERNLYFVIISVLISVVPILFYTGIKAISSYLSLLIYIVTYVPTIITLMFALQRSLSEIILVELTFALGMIIFFLADKIPLKDFVGNIRNKIPLIYLHLISVTLTIVVLIAYRGHLKFVSFDDVYVQRFENAELGIHPIIGYFVMWLTTCLYPLYIAIALIDKKKIFFVAGCAGLIIIYMATAAKLALLTPIFILAIYIIAKKNINNLFTTLILSIATLSVILLALDDENNLIIFAVSSLFFMRTLSIGGLSNLLYYDYFPTHQYTYFSHINIVNYITHNYPYGSLGLGQVIGSEYYNGPEMNANANFWAMDGIASCGLPGIIIISIVIFLFFIFINMATSRINMLFLIMLFTTFSLTLTNGSLFTSLFSGGGLLLLIILMFFKIENKLVYNS